jgi:small subunit ribosomal protein S20
MPLTDAAALSRFNLGLCFVWTSGVSYQASFREFITTLGHTATMANSKQATKRAKKSVSQRAANVSLRTALRSSIKKVQKSITAADQTVARAALKAEQAIIDSMAGKRIIHKNKAARHKSRLAAQIKALGSPRT